MSDFLAFVVQHGEIVLFLYVLADQLGVPIPAAPILLAAGGLAAAGRLSLPGAVGLGVLAALVADLIWYTVGRLRGSRVLGLLCRVSLEPDMCPRHRPLAPCQRGWFRSVSKIRVGEPRSRP